MEWVKAGGGEQGRHRSFEIGLGMAIGGSGLRLMASVHGSLHRFAVCGFGVAVYAVLANSW